MNVLLEVREEKPHFFLLDMFMFFNCLWEVVRCRGGGIPMMSAHPSRRKQLRLPVSSM